MLTRALECLTDSRAVAPQQRLPISGKLPLGRQKSPGKRYAQRDPDCANQNDDQHFPAIHVR